MPAHDCPGCLALGHRTVIAAWMELCSDCRLALDKYGDENPAAVHAYAEFGMRKFEQSLASHAEFARRYPEEETQ